MSVGVSPTIKDGQSIAIAALLCSAIFIGSYLFARPAEDAVILYEYSKNFANEGIITYSNATFPIEGATDFLWMILIGLMHKMGFDDYLSSVILNGAALIGLLFEFVRLRLRPWVFCLLVIATPYLWSAALGFSTIFFCYIYVIVLILALRGDAKLYLTMLLLCLIRPDGVVWCIGPFIYSFIRHEPRTRVQNIKLASAFLIVPGLTFFAFRVWYFSELLPLPFIVKSNVLRDLGPFYQGSADSVLRAFLPVALSFLFMESKRKNMYLIIILFTVPLLFYSIIDLEQDAGNRFLAPMFFGWLLVLTQQRGSRYSLLVYGCAAVVLSISIWRDTFEEVISSRNELIFDISVKLKAYHGNMLTTEAGRLAYYSDWDVDDSWGLNTPTYAKNLITRQEIQQKNYDLVVAHCYDLGEAAPALESPQPRNRSWTNQCQIIKSVVFASGYNIYYLPFRASSALNGLLRLSAWKRRLHFGKPGQPGGCERYDERYDMFAVRKDWRHADDISRLLESKGAIKGPTPSEKYKLFDDQICAQR